MFKMYCIYNLMYNIYHSDTNLINICIEIHSICMKKPASQFILTANIMHYAYSDQ